MVKKYIKAMIIICVFILIILTMLKMNTGVNNQQFMNKINYDITLHENGDMTIVEDWDIYISHTNTIFKNFDISNKFGEIKDVTVKDLSSNTNLTKIDEEMYHVTTDCYYALEISGNKFEIAWGTGMEKRSGNKKYQITYTVTDVVSDYKDCQEWYWQILSDANEIPVKKVNGTIKLPYNVENIENLKVWGHGPLNGKIEKVFNDTVKFEVDNLEVGEMLELRVATSEKIFKNLKKVNDYNYLNTIIDKETEWADESNIFDRIKVIILILWGILYGIYSIVYVFRIIKYKKILKKKDDGLIHTQLRYYREIPREEATPSEANYLFRFDKDINQDMKYQSDIVAATILDLCLKKCIDIEMKEKQVCIKIENTDIDLKRDEKEVLKLLKNVAQGREEFFIEDIKKYAKDHYSKYSTYINNIIGNTRINLYKMKFINKADQDLYKMSKRALNSFQMLKWIIITAILAIAIANINIFEVAIIAETTIAFLPTILEITICMIPILILKLVSLKILSKTQNRIAVITQKGLEEQEKWKGLANYMKEISLLNEKEVPSLIIWEKYLVYATAFGIADEVIEQMKAKYPGVFIEEYWDKEKEEIYKVTRFVSSGYSYYNTNPISSLKSNASSAYSISLREISRHTNSSGSGGGGGFSGGGGGGRNGGKIK